jgi:hypothetical protein
VTSDPSTGAAATASDDTTSSGAGGVVVRVAAYVALAAVGALLAMWGAFLVPLHIGPVVGLSVMIAVVGNLAVGLLGAAGMGTRLGATVPGAAWFLVALVLGAGRPEGDLVVPGHLPTDSGVAVVGTLYVLAGSVAAALAVGLGAVRLRPRFTAPRAMPRQGA